MTQNIQLTNENIRDSLLSLFEEHEEELVSYAFQIEKIENDGVELFERKVIAIKNKLVNDVNVLNDDLQKKYLEEVELARKEVLEGVEHIIQELVNKQSSSL